jgi:hypothetical protein
MHEQQEIAVHRLQIAREHHCKLASSVEIKQIAVHAVLEQAPCIYAPRRATKASKSLEIAASSESRAKTAELRPGRYRSGLH